jgi:hypothetical protein
MNAGGGGAEGRKGAAWFVGAMNCDAGIPPFTAGRPAGEVEKGCAGGGVGRAEAGAVKTAAFGAAVGAANDAAAGAGGFAAAGAGAVKVSGAA